jgi:hypothetical protein
MAPILGKQSGFVLVWMCFLLPVLMTILLALNFFIGLMQVDQRLHYVCHENYLPAQRKVSIKMIQLFALNPKAVLLETQLAVATAQLVAATAIVNPPAIAAAMARIAVLERRRWRLKRQQQKIIKAANALIKKTQQRTYTEMLIAARRISASWNKYILFNIQIYRPLSKALAVKPVYPDEAPPYQTKNNFLNEQAMELKWKVQLMVQRPWNRWVNLNLTWEQKCNVSLKGQMMIWNPVINEENSYWGRAIGGSR